MQVLGVHIRFTSVYHPQAHPTERVNRVIKTMIASYVQGNHRTWDSCLPQLGFALRAVRHEVTGYSPAYLNFGPVLTPDHSEGFRVSHGQEVPLSVDPTQWAGKLAGLEPIYREVQIRLARAYEKSTTRYNLRRRQPQFQVEDTVWKRTYTLSKASEYYSAKLAPKFVKCRIKRKISTLVYELTDEDGKNLGN